jgi:hypothetical protein
MSRMESKRRTTNLEEWVPKTRLGKMIQEGKITTIEDVFLSGIKISEPQVVDSLIPDLQEEVINVNLVQKQTDAGEKIPFQSHSCRWKQRRLHRLRLRKSQPSAKRH